MTPDNGTLTHVKQFIGITEVREIDETINRLPNSGESHTFHGRDIFAYTGARLASGVIQFEDIGHSLDPSKLFHYHLKIRQLLMKLLQVMSILSTDLSVIFGRILAENNLKKLQSSMVILLKLPSQRMDAQFTTTL